MKKIFCLNATIIISLFFCFPVLVYGGVLRQKPTISEILPGIYAGDVQCGDLNNDGYIDIVIIGEAKINGDFVRIAKVYRNTGSNFVENSNPIKGVYFGSVDFGDYNNDGLLDIAVSGMDSDDKNLLQIYKNTSSSGGTIEFSLDNQQTEILSSENQLRYSSLDWGDYNKDGLLDLAVCGMNSLGEASTIIFKNRGRLSYILEKDVTQILLNINKGQIRWADYDNDGDLDLSVCGFNSQGKRAAKVFKNNPTGILREDKDNSELIQKLSSSYMEWGDADNDGDFDLLQSGWYEGWYAYVSLLENRIGGRLSTNIIGDLTSNHPELYLVGPVAWGDYDNDGDFDIAMMGTNEFSQALAFILKNNKGTFEIDGQQIELEGLKNGFLRWFDYNNDGRLDLIAGGEDGNGVRKTYIYENDELQIATRPLPPSELKATFITNNDVVFSWEEGSDVDYEDTQILSYILRIGQTPGGNDIFSGTIPVGNGNAGNKPSYKLNIPLSRTTYYWSVKTVDAQYQVSDEYTPEASFLVKRFVNSNQSITDLQQSALSWGDYNNDGYQNLIVAGEDINGKSRTVLFDNQNGTLIENTDIILPYVKNGCFTWEDYDNDGDLDLAMSGNTGSYKSSYIFKNDPVGTLTLDNVNSNIIENVDQSSMDWGDYDNDGDIDLALMGVNAGGFYITKIYRNTNGSLIEDDTQNLAGYANGRLNWIDYDNDGDLDLAIVGDNLDYESGRIYKNDGSGNLSEDSNSSLPAVFASDMAWCDFDSDGDLDAVISGHSLTTDQIELKVMINNPVGKLTENATLSSTLKKVRGGSIVWGDFDNDGDADLIISGNDVYNQPVLEAYRYNNNTFNRDIYPVFLGNGVQFSSISLIDIENDGDLDLVTIGAGGVNLTAFSSVYDNNEAVVNPNEAPQPPTRLTYELDVDQVLLKWNRGTDLEDNGTDSLALTYAYRMGNTPGGNEIASGKFEHGFGKLGFARSIKVKNLKSGIYYWGVKTIDNGFKESEWVNGQSFIIDLIKTDVVSKYPDQGETGVSVSTTIKAAFNEDINKEQFISDKSFRLYYEGTRIEGTIDYNIETREALFIPKDKLRGNSTYEVRITGNVSDIFGNLMGADKTWTFKTAETVLAGAGGLVKNKFGDVQLYISPNALTADEEVPIIEYTPADLDPPDGITFSGVAYKIGPENRSVSFSKAAILTIKYNKSALPAGMDEDKLKIFGASTANPDDFFYDVPIGGTLNKAESEIVAVIPKLGLFGIFEDTRDAWLPEGISNVNFSPRVFSPAGSGQMTLPEKTGISFTLGEPINITITVFSQNGRYVNKLTDGESFNSGGQVVFWDGRDGDGNVCTSGIYIVKIEGGGSSVLKTVGILNK